MRPYRSMGHREKITDAAKALADADTKRKTALRERNRLIRAASTDEVPDASIARWTGLSAPQVRRILRSTE